MSRLTIEIAPEQHRMIKALATISGQSIKDFILDKTLTKPAADTTSHLLSSKKNAKRLRDAISSPKSRHHKFQSLDELKHAIGI
jgi:uncharacterized protein (DUF1778 family)